MITSILKWFHQFLIPKYRTKVVKSGDETLYVPQRKMWYEFRFHDFTYYEDCEFGGGYETYTYKSREDAEDLIKTEIEQNMRFTADSKYKVHIVGYYNYKTRRERIEDLV